MTCAVGISNYQIQLLNRENTFLKINSMKQGKESDNLETAKNCLSSLDGDLLLIARQTKTSLNSEA